MEETDGLPAAERLRVIQDHYWPRLIKAACDNNEVILKELTVAPSWCWTERWLQAIVTIAREDGLDPEHLKECVEEYVIMGTKPLMPEPSERSAYGLEPEPEGSRISPEESMKAVLGRVSDA